MTVHICRFAALDNPRPQYGILDSDRIQVIDTDPFDNGDITASTGSYDLKDVRLLAPCSPTKIVAVGLNYRDHAAELGMKIPEEPLIFLKPSTCVIGPRDKIIIPSMSKRVDHEAELGIVIGKKAKNISDKEAMDVIMGFTCLNDVTARDLQYKDVQFTRAKSFDTFCPIGPSIVKGIDPSSLDITCTVNGEIRQSSNTSNLIHSVPEVVSFISRIMTLLPGDVIATGTPPGISQLNHGDTVTVTIKHIGSLTNPVSA